MARRAHIATAPMAAPGRSAACRVALALAGPLGSVLLGAALLVSAAPAPAAAAAQAGWLASVHRHQLLASTSTAGGQLNPYAVVVAPVSAGRIHRGDVLVTNFNGASNLQGTGTTIVDFDPSDRKTTLFASLPQRLPQCPGGVGLGAAMTMLRRGWIIVGSTPSSDGTAGTLGRGCLLVLDARGRLAGAWSGPHIRDPWGNMALIDRGSTATLFVSMAGFDVPGPARVDPKTGLPVTVYRATVLRLELAIPVHDAASAGKPPVITAQTVVASGLGERADRDAFLIGPTGLALGPTGALYVSDALGNRIVAIPDAVARTGSAGIGRLVTQGGLLRRPLAMCLTAGGHLLVTNALDGRVVEIDPVSGRQLGAQWLDTDQAQSPPGSGDLFGLAMAPHQDAFYYVEDDVNTLMEAAR